MSRLWDLWRLLRPYQWIKNSFVFTGVIFSEEFRDVPLFLQVVVVAFAFSFVSSSVYIINDIADCERDRSHPHKKNRPIASGRISIPEAITSSVTIGIFGLLLGAWVSLTVTGILALYLLINLVYSFKLQHIVILDVFCIASGFMLRILAGTLGVGIPPSEWLLLCSLMLTLFLGFTKRRAEILALLHLKKEHRKVLDQYSAIFLDEIIAICATGVILTYSLYTMSPNTIQLHNTANLIYTVPFVIYALFRYLYLLHHRKFGGDPTRDLMRDTHIIVSVFGWTALSLFLLT